MVWTYQKQKILRRGGKNTQKNCTKKDLHNPDNHDGMISHLEPNILECEVKWALGNITANKGNYNQDEKTTLRMGENNSK